MLELPDLTEGRLLKRYKRFLADVVMRDGRVVTAHCPNPGSMRACLGTGWRVLLSYHPGHRRKLQWTLEMIHNGRYWLGVNPLRANDIARAAIDQRKVPGLRDMRVASSEVRVPGSRLDFLLEPRPGRPGLRTYLEVKSVTMRRGRVALFPDSPSARGRKHLIALDHLARQARTGAAMLFVIERPDIECFSPADDIDPEYGRMLRAIMGSVSVFALKTRWSRRGILIEGTVPLRL